MEKKNGIAFGVLMVHGDISKSLAKGEMKKRNKQNNK